MTPRWYFYFCLLIPMWTYASNSNTTLEIMVFLRDKIIPKCHWEWHKTPTEKLASYLVRVSKRHPYLFSLEAINAPIKKRHPHHHRNHVVSTSTAAAALSSAKVLMSHGNTALPRHAPGLHYHADLMASAISSSSAAVTRPGTRLPSPTTAQSQDRSSPTCTSPSQLVAFRATYFIPSSPEDTAVFANRQLMS